MKRKADIKRILLFGIPLIILAIGVKMLDEEKKILWVENNEPTSTSARFFYFTGEKERLLKANEDQTVIIEWKPRLDRGRLVLEIEPSGDGHDYRLEGKPRNVEVELEEGEKVQLTVRGERAKGGFLISWGKKREGG